MTEDLINALAQQLQKGLSGQGESVEMDALVQQLRKNMLAQLASSVKKQLQTKQDDDDEGFKRPSSEEIENFILRLKKERIDQRTDESTYPYTKDFDRILKYVQSGDDRE
jgi:hypothetical protein